MPILKEVQALLRRSVAERGVSGTIVRCVVAGPRYTWHRLREVRRWSRSEVSEFDRSFGVDTDGAINDITRVRDLDITSPNWIHAVDYIPVKPDRFRRALSAVPVAHREYIFIDFGCGKGRAVILAAEYPFQKVVGIDFSPELVNIARTNWKIHTNPAQLCQQAEFVYADFLDYELPQTPTVLFFYNPCAEPILARVAGNIRTAVRRCARRVFVLYVNPRFPHVWSNAGFRLVHEDQKLGYQLYSFNG